MTNSVYLTACGYRGGPNDQRLCNMMRSSAGIREGICPDEIVGQIAAALLQARSGLSTLGKSRPRTSEQMRRLVNRKPNQAVQDGADRRLADDPAGQPAPGQARKAAPLSGCESSPPSRFGEQVRSMLSRTIGNHENQSTNLPELHSND